MEEPKDKRTKLYKQWKELQGLGDVIEKITEVTGVKAIVNAIVPDDCGCSERKEKLNTMFPIRVKAQRCLTPEQYTYYDDYYNTRTLNTWSDRNVIQMLIDTYAHVFAIQYHMKDLCVNCKGSGRILKTISDRLDEVYKTYE